MARRKQTKQSKPEAKKRKVDVLGELLKIRDANGGRLLPQDIVDHAQDSRHPLHSFFEWNDTKAAVKWRLEQATRLISIHWRQDMGGEGIRVPCFMSTHPVTGEKGYLEPERISSETMRHLAIRDLEGWGHRYRGALALYGYQIPENLAEAVGLNVPMAQRRQGRRRQAQAAAA